MFINPDYADQKCSLFHYSSKNKIVIPFKKKSTYSLQYNTLGANLGYLGYANLKNTGTGYKTCAICKRHNKGECEMSL